MDLTPARSICLFLVALSISTPGASATPPDTSVTRAAGGTVYLGGTKLDPPDQQGAWSRVPQEIRKQLHMSINRIPLYPEDDDRLKQVRSWPKTRVFDGKEYVQEFSAWQGDVGQPYVRSLSEIDSGSDYNSYYATYSKDGERSSGRGPSYWWRADSTLMERSYVTPASNRTWSYDRSGVLYQFQFTERDSSDGSRRSGTEWFAGDGSLIACTVGNQHYWRGIGKEWSELYRLLAELYHWKGPY